MSRSIAYSRASAGWWLCVALLAWISASDARAQASHPALHWSRAENAADCVDPKTLAELVETYTGPVLVAPASADASIEGTIERVNPEEFRMRVSITVTRGRPAGQRVLSLPAADCRKLDGAIAFVIASTLDPDLGGGALPAELSWLSSESPAAEALREELTTTAPATPPAAQRWMQEPTAAASDPATTQVLEESPAESSHTGRWELGLAFVAGRGRVPKAAAGGLFSVARTFGSAFALTLHFRGNATVGGFDIEAGRSASVNTFDSALLACLRTSSERALGFQSCLGPGVGFLSARGTGFEAPHTVVQPLYGGQLKLEARYEVASGLSLTAAGLLDLGFRRPLVQYQVLNVGHNVFRTEVYSLQGALGVVRVF